MTVERVLPTSDAEDLLALVTEIAAKELKPRAAEEEAADFIAAQSVNVLVMDVEGAERQILGAAALEGVDRVFLELHDHLYGLSGVREIFASMDRLGFSYDPRQSSGPCVLFLRDDGQIRPYCG